MLDVRLHRRLARRRSRFRGRRAIRRDTPHRYGSLLPRFVRRQYPNPRPKLRQRRMALARFRRQPSRARSMSHELAKRAAQKAISYFMIGFVDLFGVLRAKLVPTAAIGAMQHDGAAFAGFATHLDLTPADPDMFAIPDPASLIQVPWKPEIGWLAADLHINGKPVEHAPRHVLKRQLIAADTAGYRLKTGVEAEFFVLRPDGRAVGDGEDRQAKPCYDQTALLHHYELIRAISDAMLGLGWMPYQSDHEDA